MSTENERVREVRKQMKLSQSAFGSRIGITDSAISQIEKGKISMTDQTRRSICREFDIREEWLRDGIEPMKNKSTDDELWKIVNSRGLSADDYAFISEFIMLPADTRKAVLTFMVNVTERMKQANAAESTPEQRARARADDFYQEALAEEQAEDAWSASQTTAAKEA